MPTYNVPLGRFIVETYEPVIAGGKLGMNARILFAPNPLATDCKVALIQVVRCTVLANGGSNSLKGALGWTGLATTYALLHDRPQRSTLNDRAFHHEFEIAAVCVTGNPGWYLGGLKWGYQGDATVKPPRVITDTPTPVNEASSDWKEAARPWNNSGNLKVPAAALS